MLWAREAAVAQGRESLLEPTSLLVRTGEVVLVEGEPGHGHTALALALAGRLATTAGSVGVDGSTNAQLRRRVVGLVDVPTVSEPDGVLGLRTVIGEELAMAGHRAWPRDVERWLRANGLERLRGTAINDLAPSSRTLILARLASERPHARFLVIAAPDRHGGDPREWCLGLRDLASPSIGILVTCTPTTAAVLRHLHAFDAETFSLGTPSVLKPEGSPAIKPVPTAEGERP